MCGIFGTVAERGCSIKDIRRLAAFATQRGRDSSGLMYSDGERYVVHRSDEEIERLIRRVRLPKISRVILGHSRLITNGLTDNQPVVRDGIALLHNGIIVNHGSVWSSIGEEPALSIDSEVVAALAAQVVGHLELGEAIQERIESQCEGIVACAIVIPAKGKLLLYSNNGSLYLGKSDEGLCFSSEKYPLTKIGCQGVRQVRDAVVVDIPLSSQPMEVADYSARRTNLIPQLPKSHQEEKLLRYREPNLRRCTRCILPETMPFIEFDPGGQCNYCRNYRPRNQPKPFEQLRDLVEPFRRTIGPECIVPLSGGRDSCFSLHLIVNELKLRPITFTYDWGMVTDLGRRNISRICAKLGVENIIVAADIEQKRRNIAMNLKAWLKAPDLGMISILTAGDKHFFRHLRTIQRQTTVNLNLWGINPLEVTHFKSGFLGVPPDFLQDRVYSSGFASQAHYQLLRFRAMMRSPGYFNRSTWDTLSGEYFRSFAPKTDYFHLFDFWKWSEREVDEVLRQYEWELAPDTTTTWRIGDGTAAFYNYLYHTVAGFTEHDTFRSNQIREGDIDRDTALQSIQKENRPRYQNIRWYLDVLGFDFATVIQRVNQIPPMY